MRAPSLSVWEGAAPFLFCQTLNNYIIHTHIYASESPSCKYPHKHSDLGLKSEKTAERENAM